MKSPPLSGLIPYRQAFERDSGPGSLWERVVPTGSLALDLRLGTGGWPRGRIVEIFGPEGAGKTTLLLEALAQAQRHGGFGAFLDADHGMRRATAERLGLDLEKMPFLRTNVLEEAFERIDELVQGGAVDVIAVDSIAALVPESDLACVRDRVPNTKSEHHQHRIDHFLKTLLGPLSRSRAVLLITNQVREKVGVMFGNPETTPWETMPLRNYASQRVDVRRVGQVRDGDDVVGVELRAKVVKNRFAAIQAQADLRLDFATGICAEADLLALGLEASLLRKHGGRIYFGDESLGAGQSAALQSLRQHSDVASRLHEAILERMGPELLAETTP